MKKNTKTTSTPTTSPPTTSTTTETATTTTATTTCCCRSTEYSGMYNSIKHRRTPEAVQINKVKTLGSKLTRIWVRLEDTIDDLKAKIQKETGISTDQQRLFFQGRELRNGTLLDNNIGWDSTIVLILRLRGGKGVPKS